MKICHIHIENYRSLRFLDIDTSKHNVFIGQNNSGKSNILHAINSFYNSKGISIEDITKDQSGNPIGNVIKITLTFDELTKSELSQNTCYVYNDRIKIQCKSTNIDEKMKTEYHGYIITMVPEFPKGFDEGLKQLLESSNTPKRPDIEKFEELKNIMLDVKPSGNISIDNWSEIKKKYYNLHSEIGLKEEENISNDSYQGFIKTSQVDTIGTCIFIPAIKDPSEDLKTGSRETPITKLINAICIKENSDEIKQKYELIQQEILSEREKSKNELEEVFNAELKSWNTTVSINFDKSEISDSFPLNAQVQFNDGISTDINKKGTGLQRYIFFKFLKLESEKKHQKSVSIIFLFEEPESHLHPQMQREIADILRELQNQTKLNYQTFITTHSPQFINMKTLDEIFVISKDESCCTASTECRISWKDKKDEIKKILFFDPNVSEIFFADKIVLVEGPSEQITFNFFHENEKLNLTNVSIIVTESKDNIPIFLDIINKLKKPYSVMIDEDPYFLPNYDEIDVEKIEGKKNAYRRNREIIDRVDSTYGRITICCPDFDFVLGTSKTQSNKLGKPTASFNKLEEYKKNKDSKLNSIQIMLERLLNPQIQKENVVDQDGKVWKEVDDKNIKLSTPEYKDFIQKLKLITEKFPQIIKGLTQEQKIEILELLSIKSEDGLDKFMKNPTKESKKTTLKKK